MLEYSVYRNVVSDGSKRIVRDFDVFKGAISSLVDSSTKDFNKSISANDIGVRNFYVVYLSDTDRLMFMISDSDKPNGFSDNDGSVSMFGFKNINDSDVWIHSSLINVNYSVEMWCNLYFDEVSDGVFEIGCVVK